MTATMTAPAPATTVATMPRFTYDYATINDLSVQTTVDEKGREIPTHITVNGEKLQSSERFWNSLFATFGFNKSMFQYFSHEETFNRISAVRANDRVRLCVERSENTSGAPVNRLLAVSNPKKPIVVYDDLMEMLDRSGNEGIVYENGRVQSTHRPRVGGNQFAISGDEFANRFVMETPVDGYGLPNIYLSMLRLACMNGMIGMAKAFRSTVSLGKSDDNIAFAMTRALDQFGNDEGYAALRQRIESAATSWASAYETNSLRLLLINLYNRKNAAGNFVLGTDGADLSESPYISKLLRSEMANNRDDDGDRQLHLPLLSAMRNMTGDVSQLYGLANLDALSAKRQRALPVRCTVYDAINFATEVATHHAEPQAARMLQAWVGSMVISDYDMEGTCEQYKDFADFHIEAMFENNLTGSSRN